jgi:ribonuclease HII
MRLEPEVEAYVAELDDGYETDAEAEAYEAGYIAGARYQWERIKTMAERELAGYVRDTEQA